MGGFGTGCAIWNCTSVDHALLTGPTLLMAAAYVSGWRLGVMSATASETALAAIEGELMGYVPATEPVAVVERIPMRNPVTSPETMAEPSTLVVASVQLNFAVLGIITGIVTLDLLSL